MVQGASQGLDWRGLDWQLEVRRLADGFEGSGDLSMKEGLGGLAGEGLLEKDAGL